MLRCFEFKVQGKLALFKVLCPEMSALCNLPWSIIHKQLVEEQAIENDCLFEGRNFERILVTESAHGLRNLLPIIKQKSFGYFESAPN